MSKVHKHQSKPTLLIVLGMTVGAVVPVGIIASSSFAKSKFYDTQGYWNQACLEELAQRDVISGYPDSSFRPNFPVTRAQFAVMVSKAFPNTAQVRSPAPFIDVPLYSWAYSPVQKAVRIGFLSGYPSYGFKPHRGISRAQVLVALASGLNYAPIQSTNTVLYTYFDDAGKIPNYARNGVAAASERQLVVNYPNVRLLRPNQSAKRAEVASFLCQALKNPGKSSLIPARYIVGLWSFPAVYPPARSSTTPINLSR